MIIKTKIDGKEVDFEPKFYWGFIAYEVYVNAIVELSKKRKSVSISSVSVVASILWGGIINHYERVLEECPISYTDVYDYVESVRMTGESNPEIDKCIIDFNNSHMIQKTFGEQADDKKKENPSE